MMVIGLNRFAFVLGLLLLVLPGRTWAVSINEIRIDQTGADNDEYFELWGAANESLSGLTYLVLGDGTGGSGVVEAVVDLSGYWIASNGTFLVSESAFSLGTANLVTSLNFENLDNVTHLLVSGFSGSNGMDLDTNDDGILDLAPWLSILDSVALLNASGSGDLVYASVTVGPNGSAVPYHVYRETDGTGAWQMGTEDLSATDTPGMPNGDPPEPVSEPATVLLLGTGLIGLAGTRRNRNPQP